MKKTLSILLSILMTMSVIAGIDLSAYAAGNTMQSATNLALNTLVSGNISEQNEVDFYRIDLQESGRLSIKILTYMPWVYIDLYNSNGEQMMNKNLRWSDVSEQGMLTWTLDLPIGTYYYRVTVDGEYYGNYSINCSFVSANESSPEFCGGNNNTFQSAVNISFNNCYNGQIASFYDKTDFYRFSIAKSSDIKYQLNSDMEWVYINIYDCNYKQICSFNPEMDSNSNVMFSEKTIKLLAGDYYFVITKDGSCSGNYSFVLSSSSSNESFVETVNNNNDTFGTANSIEINNTYLGQLSYNEGNDFYRLNVTTSDELFFNFTAYTEYVYIKIYNSNGGEIYSYNPRWNENAKTLTFNQNLKLNNGSTYYIGIVKDSNGLTNYSLSINNSGFSNNLLVNKAEITNDFSVDKTVSKPKKAKLTKVKAGKKSFTAAWNKVKGASGYQIQYSTSSKFDKKSTKAVTVKGGSSVSKQVKKLKGKKTYYVRVRAYKSVKQNGKTVKLYGSWSNQLKVKTRS